MTDRKASFRRNPELNVLPTRLAWLIQLEVNAWIAEHPGYAQAPSEQIMDLVYELCMVDDSFGMDTWELAESYLPTLLDPAPVLVVSN